jgi:hypothetical protein
MPETIILEEASPDDTMVRKSTIDFPRYSKQDNSGEYMKFVTEATPRKIYPFQNLYQTVNT